MLGAMGRHGDLALLQLEDISASNALTLREWRGRAPGYDEHLIRLRWFYPCHCEGGLLERSMGDVQMLFARPGYRSHYPLTADV